MPSLNSRKDLAPRLGALTAQLSGARGKCYWRTLEELSSTETFQELMRQEFPEQADVWPDSLSRRRFLTLMGASLALAGLSGCSVKPAPLSKIVPYVKSPRDIVPGQPLFFATTMPFAGSGVGLLVESHMGRPTKIEGNPDHPASRGATSVYHQASILTLYDPDRSQTVTYLGNTRTWSEATHALREALLAQRARRGRGLRILSGAIVSPSLLRQRDLLLKSMPEARWHVYEPVNRDAAHAATRLAFGQALETHYDFKAANLVLSLDADFLGGTAGSLDWIAQFMSRRRAAEAGEQGRAVSMNRLYVIETSVTTTGAKADHRLAVPPTSVELLARRIAALAGVSSAPPLDPPTEKWCSAVAKDLQANRGSCVVLAGDRQPPAVHLLAHLLNDHLENIGKTVHFAEPIDAAATSHVDSLHTLLEDMGAGKVELLFVLGANPVYTCPPELDFLRPLQRVPLRVHLGLYQDETARNCHWHLPEAHYLESWGDARAFDGTASLIQPLIEPLYGGRTAIELVSFLTTLRETPGEQIVRQYWTEYWTSKRGKSDFATFWKTSLHDGVIAGTAFAAKHPTPIASARQQLSQNLRSTQSRTEGETFELALEVDPTIYDGSMANNGWLQETPKPITKLTWDNAALMSPKTAAALGIDGAKYEHGGEHGGYQVPVVELTLEGRTVEAPAWVVPGHADGAITVHLGYGRDFAGNVGGNREHRVGFNAYTLRSSKQPWFATGLHVAKTGKSYPIACTQAHHLMENRDLVRAASLGHYRQNPEFAKEPDRNREREETARAQPPLTLYEPHNSPPPQNKWGMVIDLTTCVGCNACVVACQAENNIPVVGKVQVLAGREMHWIRIDRYIRGPEERPNEFHFQPVPCMHCEHAPCEYVCPVAATVHSADGLNDMVYNRCVGTRFCSNNCPYKVRRFNFFHYADYETPSLRLQYNPDVTVRSRGVMEKCTYCVQRIRHAQAASEAEGRSIADGEVLTACQAACPAGAIVFGDLNDPTSAVKARHDSVLNYSLLNELNTRPRTTYLAALRNPNPELEGT